MRFQRYSPMLAALAHKPARETGAHMAPVQMDTSAATSTNIFPACSGIETAIVALRIHGRANAPVYKSHSFTHSLPPSLVHLFTHALTHPLPPSFTHPVVPPALSLTHPATTNPLICSFTCSPVCSFTRSFTHPLTPCFPPSTHSLIASHPPSPSHPQSPTHNRLVMPSLTDSFIHSRTHPSTHPLTHSSNFEHLFL